MNDIKIIFPAAVLFVFILTVVILRKLIPVLKSHKLGQKILDIGPRWHISKEGTPTMGGISFICAIIPAFIGICVYFALTSKYVWLVKTVLIMTLALSNGLIGMIDDYTKFIKKQNEGLTAIQKYALQLVAATLFVVLLKVTGNLSTSLYIPFIHKEIELGFLYIIFSIIFITGIVNAVNLTDGIDGLASSVTLVASIFFAVFAFIKGDLSTGFFSAAIIGGTAGFLVYNFHPARIFMGDTGSLFLGGAICALGFIIGNPLILITVGIVYICEALSDILQVGYFKLTHGKRLFKMAPIHHHFEKCGWGEVKIVLVFSLVTLIFSIISFIDTFVIL